METSVTVVNSFWEAADREWAEIQVLSGSAVAHAGEAGRRAVALGLKLGEKRDEVGLERFKRDIAEQCQSLRVEKATRLVTFGRKFEKADPQQLELPKVKEWYQVTDVLPQPAETSHKSKVVDMNWPKLTEKIEVMIPNLNDGQKELLRKALVKIVDGL